MITGALDGTMTIDNRIFTAAGRESIGGDFRGLYDNTLVVTEKLWDLPMTTIGLGYGGLNMAVGFLTGEPVTIQYGDRGIEFIGGKLGLGGFSGRYYSAMTLGSVVNYFGNTTPETEINRSNYTGLPIIFGPHENTHIEQYQKYGPLFLPIYLIGGGVSGKNKLEIEADIRGNEAYKNKYGR